MRPAGGDQAEAGARAGAVGHPLRDVGQAVLLRGAGGQHEPHDVVDDRVVDEDPAGGRLQPLQLVGAEHRVAPTAGRRPSGR